MQLYLYEYIKYKEVSMSNEIRDKYKNLTFQELNKLFPNWKEDIKSSTSSIYELKKVIKSFDDFDKETKSVYAKIAKFLKLKNPTQKNLYAWAVGSRVSGRWRTKEEAEKWAHATNTEIRYSDYDYITNAIIAPDCKNFYTSSKERLEQYKEMEKFVGVRVDRITFRTIFQHRHYVEIPI